MLKLVALFTYWMSLDSSGNAETTVGNVRMKLLFSYSLSSLTSNIASLQKTTPFSFLNGHLQ
jgi:hypothetical protein